jgi:Spy/CpxP family protein refolding chaperone
VAWSNGADDGDEVDAVLAHGGHGPGMEFGGRRFGGRGHRGMRGGMGMGAFERLDLTTEQRERIAEIREREAREAIESRAQLETAGLDLRKLMRDEDPDVGRINAQIDRISKMRAELQKSRVGAMLEARNVLTDEQRAKLRESRWTPGRAPSGKPGPAPTPDDSQ